ncbi:MAG: alpha/beta hydrolase [Coleofasciculaceae cyanobacterium SM2_1_6]|nr:alpha/beta hydrolase [Coleofasciculaceae cyanobacterium SM2_1_6]
MKTTINTSLNTFLTTPPRSHPIYLPQISSTPLVASYTDSIKDNSVDNYAEIEGRIPLIFLHGFLSNKSCWDGLIALLAQDYRCIALDLLGFGDSSKPQIRYDVAIMVAFVGEFLKVMAIDRAFILGHSFGAWVGAATALHTLDNPDNLQIMGLGLIGAAGIRDDSFCGKYDQYRPLLWDTPVVDWVLSLATPLGKLTGRQAELDKIRWFREELMANPAARSFVVDRIRPEDAVDTVEKEIYRLHLPTLVIAGAEDETIPLWHSQTYAQEIQGAKLAIIPGADHSLPQKYPKEIYQLLQNLLENSIT